MRVTMSFAAAGALFALFTLAASCADVLEIEGDNEVAPEALCEKLDGCFQFDANRGAGDCADQIEKRIASEPDAFLKKYVDKRCTADCKTALTCANSEPLCQNTGALPGGPNPTAARPVCTSSDQCCGFSSGFAECSGDGKCCLKRGIACGVDTNSDGIDDVALPELCCPGAGECKRIAGGGQGPFSCGGVTCTPKDGFCFDDIHCCSGRCGPKGTCEEFTCLPERAECKTSSDCCKPIQCVNGRCGGDDPTCKTQGQVCETKADCCEGFDLDCVSGFCQRYKCEPRGADCSTDYQCCSHYCDPGVHRCAYKSPSGECTPEGESCQVDIECCSGGCDENKRCKSACNPDGPCKSGETCCSGECDKGLCRETCKAGRAECPKDLVCRGFIKPTDGAEPFSPDCTSNAPDGGPECVKKVCAADPYCCCVEWDFYCRYRVADECKVNPDNPDDATHLCSLGIPAPQ